MSDEAWILGGTGRTGRDIGARIVRAGLPVTLVGRDPARLAAAAAAIGAARTVVAVDVDAMIRAITAERPAVVVNTVGPFAETAARVAAACLPESSYLDLANDFVAATEVLALDTAARAAGRTLVTGAGFGVLATEGVLTALCAGRPAPALVGVESIPSLATEQGRLGEALARTIVQGVPYGGRRYRGGRLVAAPIGAGAHRVVTPDGETVTAAAWPSGDLIAAQRVSGAGDVVAASSEAPGGPAVRSIVPIVAALLAVPPLRELAVRRVAAIRFSDRPRPRPGGHVRATRARLGA